MSNSNEALIKTDRSFDTQTGDIKQADTLTNLPDKSMQNSSRRMSMVKH